MKLVFLLEEESAKAMLESILPRLLPPPFSFEENIQIITFEGKQDLEKRLEKRLRGYLIPDTKFIVMRDQDSEDDCRKVKEKLLMLCQKSGKRSSCLVRIACRELESFYLGDLQAVDKAFNLDGKLVHLQKNRKFKAPDNLTNAKQELKKLVPEYQQISGSREIGKFLSFDDNKSISFNYLIQGIKKLIEEY